jgi:hypothetical protein
LDLATRLGRFGSVEVRHGEGEPTPRLLSWILGFERIFSRDVQDLRSPRSDRADEPAFGEGCFDFVVNLTGRALVSDAPEVLDVLYDGDRSERCMLARIVAGGSPLLSVCDRNGTVLAVSVPALPDSNRWLGRLLAALHARLTALVVRAVEQTRSEQPPPAVSLGQPREFYSAISLLSWTLARTARSLLRRLAAQRPAERRWRIAIRRAKPCWPSLNPEGFNVLEPAPGRFHADPFLVVENGKTYLFAEEFREKQGRGAIAWTELRDGTASDFQLALERPYHLSYPFVFEHEGQIYMLPETAESGRVEIYRCDRFPDSWDLAGVLLENLRLMDPTMLKWGDLWWLFGTISTSDSPANDELFGYFAPSPFGPWTPHPANPLKSDVRSSRPAGRFIERDGTLFRPAQDCHPSYGTGLVWCEVIELSLTAYREREISRWSGPAFGAFDGVHTFDTAGGWEVVDLRMDNRRLRVRAFGTKKPGSPRDEL